MLVQVLIFMLVPIPVMPQVLAPNVPQIISIHLAPVLSDITGMVRLVLLVWFLLPAEEQQMACVGKEWIMHLGVAVAREEDLLVFAIRVGQLVPVHKFVHQAFVNVQVVSLILVRVQVMLQAVV